MRSVASAACRVAASAIAPKASPSAAHAARPQPKVSHLRHPLRPLGQSLVVVASKLVAVVQGVQGELLLGEAGLALHPERLAFKRRYAHSARASRRSHGPIWDLGRPDLGGSVDLSLLATPPRPRCHALREGGATPQSRTPSAGRGVPYPPVPCVTRWGGGGSLLLDVHPPLQTIRTVSGSRLSIFRSL